MSKALYKKWRGWLDRIKEEQLTDLLINRHIFSQFRECTASYVGTTQGADVSRWMALRFADRDFNRIARNKTAIYVTESRIRRDIKAIETACSPVKRLVNKVVAHTEADRRRVGKTKYGQIDLAIDLLESTFQRYALLVNGKVCNPLIPLDDIDVRPDFKRIWP